MCQHLQSFNGLLCSFVGPEYIQHPQLLFHHLIHDICLHVHPFHMCVSQPVSKPILLHSSSKTRVLQRHDLNLFLKNQHPCFLHSNTNPDIMQNKTFYPNGLKNGVDQVLEDFSSHYKLKPSHKDVCMTAAFIDQWGHHKGLIFHDSLPVWPEARWLTSLGNKVVAHYYQSPVGLPAWINKNLFSMGTGAKNVTQQKHTWGMCRSWCHLCSLKWPW